MQALRPSQRFGKQSVAAVGLEQLKKTADDFAREQQAARNAVETYKHKCKAAEDRCVMLEEQCRTAQAGNADLLARVKTDEEALQRVQQQMAHVQQLHTTLQRALGETSTVLEKVEQQRSQLSDSFDERFLLCADLSAQLKELSSRHAAKEMEYKSTLAQMAEANNAESLKCERKDELVRNMQQQLSTATLEMHNLHILKAQEQHNLVKDLEALREHAHSQQNKIVELDAEIKHAFAELESNQDERKDMQATIDAISGDLDRTCEDLKAAQAELAQKAEESKAIVDAQRHALDKLEADLEEKDALTHRLKEDIKAMTVAAQNAQERHARELAGISADYQSSKTAWADKEIKLQTEIEEAGKKHEQLVNRTAMEVDKLQAAHKNELSTANDKAQAHISALQGTMKVLQDGLEAAKSDRAKLEAGRNALAAEHEEERIQLEAKVAASAADITLLHAKIKQLQNDMDQVNMEKEAQLGRAMERAIAAEELASKHASDIQRTLEQVTKLEADKAAMIKEHRDLAEAFSKSCRFQYEAKIADLEDKIRVTQALSEQQQAESEDAVASMHAELEERDAHIHSIQAELAQKDKLLQHISGAAGAAAKPLPSPLRGMLQQTSTPNRRVGQATAGHTAATIPRPTPPRFSKVAMPNKDVQQEAHSGSGQTDGQDAVLREHAGSARQQLSMHSPSTCHRAVYAGGKNVRAPNSKPRTRALLCDLNAVRGSLQDDDGYGYADQHETSMGGHAVDVAANRIGYKDNRKRSATQLARASMLIKKGGVRSDPSTVQATSAGRKGSIFSTMSARSLGDADGHTATFATATKVPFECQDISNCHGSYLAAVPSYARPGFYNSAAMDLFGKASIDPYAFDA